MGLNVVGLGVVAVGVVGLGVVGLVDLCVVGLGVVAATVTFCFSTPGAFWFVAAVSAAAGLGVVGLGLVVFGIEAALGGFGVGGVGVEGGVGGGGGVCGDGSGTAGPFAGGGGGGTRGRDEPITRPGRAGPPMPRRPRLACHCDDSGYNHDDTVDALLCIVRIATVLAFDAEQRTTPRRATRHATSEAVHVRGIISAGAVNDDGAVVVAVVTRADRRRPAPSARNMPADDEGVLRAGCDVMALTSCDKRKKANRILLLGDTSHHPVTPTACTYRQKATSAARDLVSVSSGARRAARARRV